MMNVLENKILPLYYDDMKEWVEIMKNAMSEIEADFDSGRMVREYYERMFTV
jgi:starch phosphorylase